MQTYFLPVIGLVDVDKLKPGDLVGVNKDSYLILETLPAEYDARVKAMEVDERPTEQYSDIGGLDKQIQEVTRLNMCYNSHRLLCAVLASAGFDSWWELRDFGPLFPL